MDDKAQLAKANPVEPTTVTIEACPFCDSQPELRKGKFTIKPIIRYMIGCTNLECEVWVRTKFYATLLEAIAAWNTRVKIDVGSAPVVSSDSAAPIKNS